MARYVKGDRYEKRARKALTVADLARAEEYLRQLGDRVPPPALRLKPMEGHRDLWEMRAGGQNRFILRLTKDDEGNLFIVEDVGPHDIYKRWDQK